jgi:glutaredoxin 2
VHAYGMQGSGAGTSKGESGVRLYMFEHCSLCLRVRMATALKRLYLQETVVLDDDSEIMIGLVGKRVIPILVKDDGQPMLESMDMVAYVDSHGDRVLTGPQRSEVGTWACYAKSEKSWIDDPSGIAWETFHTTGENTDYGDGTGEREARVANSKACCVPSASVASVAASACCK